MKPIKGKKYWWCGHGDPRRIVALEILGSKRDGAVRLRVTVEMGDWRPEDKEAREIIWSRAEWDQAWCKPYTFMDWLPPLTDADFGPDEERCRICHGTRWYVERDFEICQCGSCHFTGKRKKTPPLSPPATRRSDFHPLMPPDARASGGIE